uniref:Uncharacterized protein n=1 Tax=Eutreptiella gymnastica TaxID=73025 RepID=A0A7S4D0N0_9EUGL
MDACQTCGCQGVVATCWQQSVAVDGAQVAQRGRMHPTMVQESLSNCSGWDAPSPPHWYPELLEFVRVAFPPFQGGCAATNSSMPGSSCTGAFHPKMCAPCVHCR